LCVQPGDEAPSASDYASYIVHFIL
jgi:hypothetical protein